MSIPSGTCVFEILKPEIRREDRETSIGVQCATYIDYVHQFDTTPMFITSVVVQSNLNIDEKAYSGISEKDKIIIMGMKQRTCTLTGSFSIEDDTKNYISGVIKEISNYRLLLPGLFMRAKIEDGYGIEYLPEFGYRYSTNSDGIEVAQQPVWLINTFDPARQYSNLGKPTFTINLIYIWDKNESMILGLDDIVEVEGDN